MELFCQVIKNSGFLGQQSIDTSRLIRRSLRCFYLGLAGAVPLFGIVMAILAIKLHREITLELRERWQLARLFVYWGLGAPLVWAYALALQPFGYLIPIIVFLGLQAFAVRAEYLAGPGAVWNPARHYLYWGVGLASAGCFGSLMLIELGVLAFIVLD